MTASRRGSAMFAPVARVISFGMYYLLASKAVLPLRGARCIRQWQLAFGPMRVGAIAR